MIEKSGVQKNGSINHKNPPFFHASRESRALVHPFLVRHITGHRAEWRGVFKRDASVRSLHSQNHTLQSYAPHRSFLWLLVTVT